MARFRWVSVCQWCGRTGSILNTSSELPPHQAPKITGKCKSHPSGNKDAEHGPQWHQR